MVQYEESIDAYTPHDVEMVKKPGETFGFHLWFDDQGSSQKFKTSKYKPTITCFSSTSGLKTVLPVSKSKVTKSKFYQTSPNH